MQITLHSWGVSDDAIDLTLTDIPYSMGNKATKCKSCKQVFRKDI